jgi:hypothetical protein
LHSLPAVGCGAYACGAMPEDKNSDASPLPPEPAEAPQDPGNATPTSEDGIIVGERGKAMGAHEILVVEDVPAMPEVPPAPQNLAPSEGTPGDSAAGGEGSGGGSSNE